MLTHINTLEDTVAALSDAEDNSVDHRKAQKIAKKDKKKKTTKYLAIR